MRHTLKADILFLIMVFVHIGLVFGIGILQFMGIFHGLTTNQSLILSQLLILAPAAIYLMITKTNPFKLIRFKIIDIATIFMVILLTLLIMPLITFINATTMLFSQNVVMTLTQEMSGNPFIINLILMAVIPAISEEFVFRGVLFHTYRKSSVLYGIVISGIVFGLMHLNFNQFSYAFVLGILFALIIEATGSIYSVMIAHFVINGSSVVSMELSDWLLGAAGQSSQQIQSQITPQYLMMVAGFYGIIAIGSTALAIGVYIWIVKHCRRENHLRAVFMVRRDENRFSIRKAISIPLILSILVCLSYMVYAEAVQSANQEENNVEYNIEDNTLDNTLDIEL
jgi:CAAX protease family protein